MTAGSVLAAPALPIVAWPPNLPVFYMGEVLYPPAFAALTR